MIAPTSISIQLALPDPFTPPDALAWLGSLAEAFDNARRERRGAEAGILTARPQPDTRVYIRVSDELARMVAAHLRACAKALGPQPSGQKC